MADTQSSIFNKEAAEKLRSPDDLEKYVRVTNPSAWVVLGACLALIAGLLIWGIFGTVTTSIRTTGTITAEGPVCMLSADEITQVKVGQQASVANVSTTVVETAPSPLSRDEASRQLGSDYLVSALVKGDWAYPVRLAASNELADMTENVPVEIEITTEKVSPISLILGS